MVVVSREYPRAVAKYKRFQRSRSNVHASLPSCLEVKEGEEVRIAECRRLDKTVSFVVIEVNTKDRGGISREQSPQRKSKSSALILQGSFQLQQALYARTIPAQNILRVSQVTRLSREDILGSRQQQ